MLKKLQDYKELITIIVFFLGGFFWLESKFPKKEDLTNQITSLYCLMDSYMTLTQLQMRHQELEKEIAAIKSEIGGDIESIQLSPAMVIQLDAVKEELSTKQDDRRDTVRKMEQIKDDLQRQVCGKARS